MNIKDLLNRKKPENNILASSATSKPFFLTNVARNNPREVIAPQQTPKKQSKPRPTRYPTTLNVRFSTDQIKGITQLANKYHLKRSHIIREAVQAHLEAFRGRV